jgi:hypothetical protein
MRSHSYFKPGNTRRSGGMLRVGGSQFCFYARRPVAAPDLYQATNSLFVGKGKSLASDVKKDAMC